ncbi:hypothetical protein BLNAU_18176 [Blattamonas nauphoetae]|uniref:Uncharacterized protein n=1 Tax=Blattamonas nauphoetae TaxID=2049346 RepID=A0ABQ9X529_9EUKA|nr:hypothetical protein BLNAU_18176 [Blattamonas nauphoetae]
MVAEDDESADAFLNSLVRTSGESLTEFINSIGVLISSPSQAIIKASMGMLDDLIHECSTKVHLALVKANLIPHVFASLNPHSLLLGDNDDIHICIISAVTKSVRLATRNGFTALDIEGDDEQQTVHETVFKQVLTPSEKYICHLCVNRFSIIDGTQSKLFLALLASLVQQCSYYQPTMEFVLHMPVFLTIPSCLTIFDDDFAISNFLFEMVCVQWGWNKTRGEVRQMWKETHRMLRMEGFDDVVEEKLRNDQNISLGGSSVTYSTDFSNLQGMNLPLEE